MAGDNMDTGESYSSIIGLVYIFNLIVGTGALTMPHAFSSAGWLLSLLIVVTLAFMSYLTATFVIEAMASANALIHWEAAKQLKKEINEESQSGPLTFAGPSSSSSPGSAPSTPVPPDDELEEVNFIGKSEKQPLLSAFLVSGSAESLTDTSSVDYYNITERIEMGKMATLFFNKWGKIAFNLCIAIYLYGDLAIYGAAVSKSLRDVICNYENATNGSEIIMTPEEELEMPCWKPNIAVRRADAYRIFLTIFLVLLGPFTFFNVQKTKYLQLLTTLLRWVAFISMIVLATAILVRGEGKGKPALAKISNVPNLFGVCVYSFMCHHSLPSLVTPVKRKENIFKLLASDYILILCFYSLLSFTGIFALNRVDDIYTLNFQPGKGAGAVDIIVSNSFLEYFLALFPVFTLSTNFPIIAITLRNNMKNLLLDDAKEYHYLYKELFFPIAAVLPPILIAFTTENLEFLVALTGSYAGVGIQYIVPALLVYYARKDALLALGLGVRNNYMSPFKGSIWIVFVLIWSVACVIFVSVYHVINKS